MTPTSITCPQCGLTSHHPDDVRERYCGNCHQYHDQMRIPVDVQVADNDPLFFEITTEHQPEPVRVTTFVPDNIWEEIVKENRRAGDTALARMLDQEVEQAAMLEHARRHFGWGYGHICGRCIDRVTAGVPERWWVRLAARFRRAG